MTETPTDDVFYAYRPSMPAATIFTIVFSMSSLFHILRAARSRTWYFTPFLMGCLFEVVGYVGRQISSTQYPGVIKGPYIMQSVSLLLAPNLLAASIYLVFGRIIVVLDAECHSIIRSNWLIKFFAFGNVMSFSFQVAGYGLLNAAKTQQNMKTGNSLVLSGLFIHIILTGSFILIVAIFQWRVGGVPTRMVSSTDVPWRPVLYVLHATSTLIFIRSIYRVAEYAASTDSDVQLKEQYFYIFDSLPIALVAVLFNWFHPARLVDGAAKLQNSYYLQDGLHQRGSEP